MPVSYEGTVVAEIDVDSDTPAAFGAADRAFLERVADGDLAALPRGLGHRRDGLGRPRELA